MPTVVGNQLNRQVIGEQLVADLNNPVVAVHLEPDAETVIEVTGLIGQIVYGGPADVAATNTYQLFYRRSFRPTPGAAGTSWIELQRTSDLYWADAIPNQWNSITQFFRVRPFQLDPATSHTFALGQFNVAGLANAATLYLAVIGRFLSRNQEFPYRLR